MPFSSDLLFYCWQYIVSTDNKPLESPLFKTMMKTYEEILRDTHNKKKWEWIKEYFIVQLIWYLPHPNIINQENESKMNDENVNTDETLKTTLFWELLTRVRNESKNQSDLLLKEKINTIKSYGIDEWKELTSFNVQTEYSNNARQDVVGCLKPNYSLNELSKYPPSTHFSASKHYDTVQYLGELLFRANVLDRIFQKDMKMVAIKIGQEKKISVTYRSGPVKTLIRSQTKVENDYISEAYPTAAKILDINRCALQFKDIKSMMMFIECFMQKIKSKQAECVVDIVRVKNGWSVYNEKLPQYTDIKLNCLVNTKHGKIIVEIQFLLDLMSAFKKKAHKLYAVERIWEFVYNFATLRENMKKFKNYENRDELIWDLIVNDDYKEFDLLWDMTKNKIDEEEVNEYEDKTYPPKVAILIPNTTSKDIPLFYIINNPTNKISLFIINKEQHILYEAISVYLKECGFIYILKLFPCLKEMVLNHLDVQEMTVNCNDYINIIAECYKNRDEKYVKSFKRLVFKSKKLKGCRQNTIFTKLKNTNSTKLKDYGWNLNYKFQVEHMHILTFSNNEIETADKIKKLQDNLVLLRQQLIKTQLQQVQELNDQIQREKQQRELEQKEKEEHRIRNLNYEKREKEYEEEQRQKEQELKERALQLHMQQQQLQKLQRMHQIQQKISALQMQQQQLKQSVNSNISSVMPLEMSSLQPLQSLQSVQENIIQDEEKVIEENEHRKKEIEENNKVSINNNINIGSNNIVSIIGNVRSVIPSIDILKNDIIFKEKHLSRSKTRMHGPAPNNLIKFYCLTDKRRYTKNSNLKRSRTTFEPKYKKKQIKPQGQINNNLNVTNTKTQMKPLIKSLFGITGNIRGGIKAVVLL
eukprot:541062_1